MNKWQWSRRIIIVICAVASGTIFLYVKQNIHNLHATNYEGNNEEFDHPFALLFLVYIGQLIIFSTACLLNAPIRNQLLADLSQTQGAVTKLFCRRAENPGELQRLLPNQSKIDERFDNENAAGNNQPGQVDIRDGPEYVIISPTASRSTQQVVFEDRESFIKLFVDGDQTLRIVNYLPPAILMLLSTSFVYYAFGATYPATIVMFRAVSLLAAGIFRSPFMCNALRIRHGFSIQQWLAVFIMMSAVLHSAYYDMMTADSDNSEQRSDISYLVTVPLLSIAHFGIALADTYDEKFLHERHGVPLIMCVVEALLGTVVYAVILPLLYFVPDPLYWNTQGGVMEKALNAFVQLKNNPTIVGYVVGLAVSETVWMAARAFITRHANALVKTIIDSLQLVFVRYVTPELYVCFSQSLPTTGFTVLVFVLGIAVFYFSERRRNVHIN